MVDIKVPHLKGRSRFLHQRVLIKTSPRKQMPTDPAARKREYDKAQRLIIDSKSVPCVDCGQQYPWWVMDFDHGDSHKVYNIGRSRHRGYNVIVAEIAKCDVVCSNCHRLRHPPTSLRNSVDRVAVS